MSNDQLENEIEFNLIKKIAKNKTNQDLIFSGKTKNKKKKE